ncbi:HAD-IIB family hydrolase [Geomicrobium sp. JSM 1781026]|uniref:HAD-IIB family hydrolase n=1 Tax=Geomicrobium sp. JSM 1781026 TaxID=3344580 RepID=UPI0035C099BA
MQFVFDLDGTLIFEGKKMSENITNTLLGLQTAGHTVTFASARSIRDMLPVLDQRLVDARLISANGAVIWEERQLRRFVGIDTDTFARMQSLLHSIGATYLVEASTDYAVVGNDAERYLPSYVHLAEASAKNVDELPFIGKILVLGCQDPTPLLEAIPTMNVTRHRHQGEARFDLTAKNVSKHQAFQSVCVEEFVVFGNDLNDIPLFIQANHSVIVGDFPPVHIHANEQVPITSRTEAALVETIQKLAEKYGT